MVLSQPGAGDSLSETIRVISRCQADRDLRVFLSDKVFAAGEYEGTAWRENESCNHCRGLILTKQFLSFTSFFNLFEKSRKIWLRKAHVWRGHAVMLDIGRNMFVMRKICSQ